jgi:serine/threonine protein kinase
VRYLGSFATKNHVHIMMEYASQGSIQSIRSQFGPLKEPAVRRYAAMVLEGLRHLHRHGIIHRDIKGANVLLDDKGCVKICDFGCSLDLARTLNSGAGGAGTLLWMAPEVCRGEPSTKESDIWSFGCLLLEMTNESGLPWEFGKSMTLPGVAYAIGSAVTPPSTPMHLSRRCRAFIESCLQLRPEDRFSVDELLEHPFIREQSSDEYLLGQDDLRSVVSFIPGEWDYTSAPAMHRSINEGFRLVAVDEEDDSPPGQSTTPTGTRSVEARRIDSGNVRWMSGGGGAVPKAQQLYSLPDTPIQSDSLKVRSRIVEGIALIDAQHLDEGGVEESRNKEKKGVLHSIAERFKCLSTS